MLNTMRLLALGSLVTTALAGCAGVSSSATPPNFTGTWIGGSVGSIRDMTLHLQQNGTNVTGTLAGVGAPDGPVHGVVGGDTVQLSAERAAFAPRLVVRGDVMNGELNGLPLNLVRFGATQTGQTQTSR